MPSRRRRLVCSKLRSRFFEKFTSASAVASWTIASGSALRTASRTARASSRSRTTASAPSACTRAAFSGDLDVPVTS